jgi:hypothetical protein
MDNQKEVCTKCNNTGKVTDKDGTIHCCFDCLLSGRLDNHDKVIKDSGIRV